MTNTELLMSNMPNSLLTTIEQQERFILQQAAIKKSCPNCHTLVNQFEAAGLSVDEFNTHDGHGEYRYQCPACKRELNFCIPLVGGWVWTLVPVKVKGDAK